MRRDGLLAWWDGGAVGIPPGLSPTSWWDWNRRHCPQRRHVFVSPAPQAGGSRSGRAEASPQAGGEGAAPSPGRSESEPVILRTKGVWPAQHHASDVGMTGWKRSTKKWSKNKGPPGERRSNLKAPLVQSRRVASTFYIHLFHGLFSNVEEKQGQDPNLTTTIQIASVMLDFPKLPLRHPSSFRGQGCSLHKWKSLLLLDINKAGQEALSWWQIAK